MQAKKNIKLITI